MTADEIAGLAERAARIVNGGGGLKALAQLLADAASGAVLVEDDQWRHLALAECAEGVGVVPPSFAPFFAGRAADDGDVARAKIDDGLGAICAAMPGGADGEGLSGYVTLFVRGKPPGPLSAALRVVASAAGVECVRRGAGRSQSRRAFWEHLLNEGFSDSGSLKDEASAAGVIAAAAYVAALFDPEGASPSAIRDGLTQALSPTDAVCPPISAGGHVVVLFPVRHQADVARARQAAGNAVRDLAAAGVARSLTCGIGGHHQDPTGARRSLAEAQQAVAIGKRFFGRGSVTTHADLGVLALLHSGGDREAFAKYADAAIEPLVAYDRQHKTELVKTLRLYFDVGENVKEAAERLCVHRHTIFYRLNQISQILKIDLHSSKDQLGVRAALAIRRMHSDEE
jgi:hypothetical protein